MVAVNQPLIIGDGPGPGAVYSEPFTDDARPMTQSRSLSATTGPGSRARESDNSSQAVVSFIQAPPPDLRGGLTAEDYHQQRSTDYRSPPPRPPLPPLPSGITRSRSRQSLAKVQTQPAPEPPVHRLSSPSFDAGALAYLRYNDQETNASPPSPMHLSPRNAEDHRLTSAFSVASELSPQYTPYEPPPNIDEMWRSSPDPIKASSSYRPIDRRQSFTPSVGDHGSEPGDNGVIQGHIHSFAGPRSNVSSPRDYFRGGNFASHPSPIPEVTHSQEGSNNTGTWSSIRSRDTTLSSPVQVMRAERVQLTPVLSLGSATYASPPSPPTPSSASQYEESLPSTGSNKLPQPPPPPLLPLPQVQPLSLGKKRSVQGPY
jgi:hypothetical protein